MMMKHMLALLLIAPLCAQTPEQLEARGASVANATYQGKSAVRLDALPSAANGESYAIVKGSRFHKPKQSPAATANSSNAGNC